MKEKKGSKDIEILLKSCEKLTDLHDLLNTSVGDNTRELISSFLQCIAKTASSVESLSSPKAPEVSHYLYLLKFLPMINYFILKGKQRSFNKRSITATKEAGLSRE